MKIVKNFKTKEYALQFLNTYESKSLALEGAEKLHNQSFHWKESESNSNSNSNSNTQIQIQSNVLCSTLVGKTNEFIDFPPEIGNNVDDVTCSENPELERFLKDEISQTSKENEKMIEKIDQWHKDKEAGLFDDQNDQNDQNDQEENEIENEIEKQD